MYGSGDMAGMSDCGSRRTFFHFEIVCQDQPLEMKLESTPDVSHVEMRGVRGPFLSMRFWRIFSLAVLSSSSVAAFHGLNSDSRNGMFFATSQEASEIIAPEAPYSRAAFLDIRRDSPSEGDGCMKDTDHPIRHPSVHRRIFGRVRSRRSCAWHNDQFGRGQNTGLGWSDRAEYFVRAAFNSREPQ